MEPAVEVGELLAKMRDATTTETEVEESSERASSTSKLESKKAGAPKDDSTGKLRSMSREEDVGL